MSDVRFRLFPIDRGILERAFLWVCEDEEFTSAWMDGAVGRFSDDTGSGARAMEAACYGDGALTWAQSLAALCYLEAAYQRVQGAMDPLYADDMEMETVEEAYGRLARRLEAAIGGSQVF
jgi:hypothetical protein